MGSMRPIWKGVLAGAATVGLYLSVVVFTTPALDPLPAVSAAFQINSVVIVGMGVGIGLQVLLSEKGRMMGCRIGAKRRMFGGSPFGACSHAFPFLTRILTTRQTLVECVPAS